jgi:hypothetical protein
MHDELERRLRAARGGLRSPDPSVGAHVLTRLETTAAPARVPRRRALSRRLGAIGAVAGVGALIAVLAVLLVTSRTTEAPGSGPPVTVPDVTGRTLEAAYGDLRAAGLAVTLREWTTLSRTTERAVRTQTPAAASTVDAGTPVELTTRPAIVAPSVPPESPEFVVENFVGGSMADAVAWARARSLNWTSRLLPPVVGATAPSLLDNYRVARQRPAEGEPVSGAGPLLELWPVVTTSEPRLDAPEIRFSAQGSQIPLTANRRSAPRSLEERRGSVTAIVFSDPSCANCPAAPTTPVPGLSVEDSFAPRYLVSLGLQRRQPTWAWNLRPFWHYGEVADNDLAALVERFQVEPGDALLADRMGRVAMIVAHPVDPTEVADAVAELQAEPLPSLAELGIRMSRMDDPPLPADQVPDAFALAIRRGGGPAPAAHLLTTRPDGTRVIAALGDDPANLGEIAVWTDPVDPSRAGLSSTTLANLKEQLATNWGVVAFGGTDDRLVYLLADGFTEVRIGDRVIPVDGNAVIIDASVDPGATAEFRGPGKVRAGRLPSP